MQVPYFKTDHMVISCKVNRINIEGESIQQRMDQYKKQTHKWMVIRPIELKHPTINVANKLAEILLKIRICELIFVTGHLDTHPDAHSTMCF